MPRTANVPPRISPRTLVAAAKAQQGIATDRALAHAMSRDGFDPVATTDSIGRWRRGQSQPEYAPTLTLLELADLLCEDRVRALIEGGT